MKFQATAIYCTLFTAFAADMVHANLITAWGKEKLVSSSTGGTFVSKVLRTVFSRHLQLDTNQVYHYTLVGDDLEGPGKNNYFGSAVAVSGDGTRVAVGSQRDYGYTGSVIVFEYNPSTLQWAPFGTKIRGQSGGDYFGASLAMSNDGSRLAVGAPYHNYGYTGHVRVYQYNSVDDEWSLMGIDLDGDVRGGYAGTSVTISGDGSRVAMGAPFVSSSTDRSTAGRVLIFSYDGTNWVPSGDAIESQVRAFLGGAVALSENGNRLVVGGRTFTPPTNDGDPPLDYAGSVSVYDFVDNDWVQAGESLFGLEYYDRFGNDVDISDDGFRIVIGAFTSDGQDLNLRDIGQVSVFQEDTSIPAGWSQVGASINGESESDKLGSSVSISGNGKVVVLGSPDNDDVKQNTGEVEVYQYVEADDIWKQVGIDIGGECKNDGFGGDVAISDDGTRIVVGSNKGNYYAGTTRVFEAVVGAGDGTDGANDKCPTFTPSRSPSLAPVVAPSEDEMCIDSLARMSINGKSKGCNWVGKKEKRCSRGVIASHCPKTCGACAEYECADSKKKFVLPNGKEKKCGWIGRKDKEARCLLPKVMETCRDTCGFCLVK